MGSLNEPFGPSVKWGLTDPAGSVKMEPDDTRSAELLAYRQRGRFHRNATKALLSNTLMYFLIVFVSFLKISFKNDAHLCILLMCG